MNNHSQMQSMSVPPSAHEPSSECPYWLALIGGGCCGTLLMAKSRHLFSSSSQPLKAASLAFLPKTPAAAAQSRPSNASNPLAFLDIFRFVALCWVVINHLGSEGRLDILRRQPSGDRFKQAVHDHPIFGALLGNSALGVEIFLLLSGLLAARSWHRHQRPEAPFWRNAGTFLFRRWLRLAPPVMAFVLLATSPLVKWAMPQFHLSMASNCNCGQLLSYPLMVNNWAREPTCLGWLWYLGLDWQCYLAAPFLLHAIAKLRRPMALMLVGTLALGSMLLRGWHCSQHGICNKSDVDIPFVHFPGAPADPAKRAMFASLFSLYARPATKCGPFLIGLLLGWLSLQKEQLPKWSPIARRRLFLGGLAMAVAVVYGILPEYWHPEQGNTLYNTLYTATFRTLFAGAIGLMILSRLGLQPEESAPVSPVWAQLARLTFSAFLLHMPVVFLFNHVVAYQRAVSVYGLLAALPAALGLSFGAAFLFHTFVEQPLQRLTSRLSGQ